MNVFVAGASFLLPRIDTYDALFDALLSHRTSFSMLGNRPCGAITSVDREPHADRVISLAQHCAAKAQWELGASTGVVIGSSRGATGMLEEGVQQFLTHHEVPPQTSPRTTMGLLSATVARTLGITGLDMTHSSTCSTALMSMLNGAAWCEAGLVDRAVVGASEAPLTPFGFAQMDALRIYSALSSNEFPSRPFSADRSNTFVLAEGAGLFLLERQKTTASLARIAGFGCCVDNAPSGTGVSVDGDNYVSTMTTALKQYGKTVDAVVCHATGTIKGDAAERSALMKVFGDSFPLVVAPKWLHGHSFASSGVLGIVTALALLHRQDVECTFPYETLGFPKGAQRMVCGNAIMINASGFGGNTVSLILERT